MAVVALSVRASWPASSGGCVRAEGGLSGAEVGDEVLAGAAPGDGKRGETGAGGQEAFVGGGAPDPVAAIGVLEPDCSGINARAFVACDGDELAGDRGLGWSSVNPTQGDGEDLARFEGDKPERVGAVGERVETLAGGVGQEAVEAAPKLASRFAAALVDECGGEVVDRAAADSGQFDGRAVDVGGTVGVVADPCVEGGEELARGDNVEVEYDFDRAGTSTFESSVSGYEPAGARCRSRSRLA